MLIAGAPRMITSPSMSNRGITARATATITNIVINLLTIFRQSEILVGRLDFASSHSLLSFNPCPTSHPPKQ